MKKIYLIAVVIALAAGLATYFFANELKTSKIVTGVNEATVVIALEDIDENTILTAEMFQEIKLPVTAVSYSTVSSVKDVVGYMATSKILKGEQLMAGKIIPVGEESAASYKLSQELENGKYAYSITLGIENAVSYFLKENDYIDIYDVGAPAAPLLKNVRVMKIGDYPANIQQDKGTEITSYAIVTLELDRTQISKLIPYNDGRLRAVLVSYVEAYSLADDLAAADIPEDRTGEPQTNYGMGEITTAPPTTQAS